MTPTVTRPTPQKPGKWVIINTAILILINLYLAFIIGTAEAKFGGGLFGLAGFALGRAVLVPVFFVCVSSISKKYRNNRSRAIIMMWGSVFILISSVGGLARLGAQLAE